MKSGYFIMKMWQTGNVGPHNIQKLKDNPHEGYKSYDEAKAGMLDLKEKGNWELKQTSYSFAIMEVFWS
ncbi:MAG: hypothetical protein AABY15_06450 [Nanoarchaeota archaeon]